MVESTKFILFVLISLSCPISLVAYSNEQKTLTDLRRFKIEEVAARFAVDRSVLERELQNRKQQDVACGQEVKLQLPQSPPHASYDTSYQGETVLLHTIVTDYTLAAEMSNDLAEQVATSFRLFVVALPVVFGVSDKHGALPLHEFTNSTKKILDPHFIHYSYITQASSLEEKDDGTVTIRLGDDIMVYQVQDKVKCKTKCKVGKDFDETIGDIVTNYPLPFYSGCELLGSQISFCLVLQDVQCELAAVGRDVCVFTSTISSERCATTMKIVNMTGIFRDMFPFLAEIFPAESFEAELIDREHQTGIMFPCVTR